MAIPVRQAERDAYQPLSASHPAKAPRSAFQSCPKVINKLGPCRPAECWLRGGMATNPCDDLEPCLQVTPSSCAGSLSIPMCWKPSSRC